MKDSYIVLLFVLLVAQASGLALSRQHDAACATCPAGYSLSSGNCLQNCPGGWADQGASCKQSEYGRRGYNWKYGDSRDGDSGMIRRCEADNGAGNCEKFYTSYYPKCKAGYKAAGCCVCRAAPDCNALGFNGGSDQSCTKKVITC